MDSYSALAQMTHQAYQQGDDARAALFARILERLWAAARHCQYADRGHGYAKAKKAIMTRKTFYTGDFNHAARDTDNNTSCKGWFVGNFMEEKSCSHDARTTEEVEIKSWEFRT